MKTTNDISLDSQISLLPLGFSLLFSSFSLLTNSWEIAFNGLTVKIKEEIKDMEREYSR